MIALLVVDLQRWMFRHADRMAQAPGLLRNVRRLTTAFEAAGLPIFDVVTLHEPDRSTWSRLMLAYDHPCMIEGTPDVEPLEGYAAPAGARRVVKRQNSAFFGTDLAERLRADGVGTVMLAGVFVDGCIGLTAADAAQHRFEAVCIEDAVGHVDGALRGPVLDLLRQLYEIEAVPTQAALERIAGRTGDRC
jgi:nicotinamidase-related amidase